MIDLTTYALLRKQIATAASGISDVRVEGDELVFVLVDGHEVRMAIPATEIRDAVVRDDVLVLTLEDNKEIVVDTTLTQSGQAADAKVTGDALACKLTEPSTGLAVGKYFRIAAIDENGHAVLEAVDLPSAPVQDVQVAGTSIVADGVANVPLASNKKIGLVRFNSNAYGIGANAVGEVYFTRANESQISNRTGGYYPLTPTNYDYAVKAAMCDGKGATWTADEQAAARERMGIDDLGAWEDIVTVTAEESISFITVDKDSNGNPFALSHVICELIMPAESGSKSRAVYFGTKNDVSYAFTRVNSYTNEKTKSFALAYAKIVSGKIICESAISAAYSNGYQEGINKSIYDGYAYLSAESFDSICVFTYSDAFPAGCSLKIRGIRK